MTTPQADLTVIKRKRKELIRKMKLSLEKFEMLEEQEDNYRERKKILNLNQNKKRKKK